MYSVNDISEMLNVTANVVYKAVNRLEIKSQFICNKKNYYSKTQLEAIKNNIIVDVEKIKFYPLKTTETFYIYESRMNYPD